MTYKQKQKRPYENRATWELQAIKKALSMLQVLNTEEENKRLEEVTKELKFRK